MKSINLSSIDSIYSGKIISSIHIQSMYLLQCKYYPQYDGFIKKTVEAPRINNFIDKLLGLSPRKIVKKEKDKFSAIVQLNIKGSPVVLDKKEFNQGEKYVIKYSHHIYPEGYSIPTPFLLVPMVLGKSLLKDENGEYYEIYKLPSIEISLKDEIRSREHYFETSEEMISFLKYLINNNYIKLESLFNVEDIVEKKVDFSLLEKEILEIFNEFNKYYGK